MGAGTLYRRKVVESQGARTKHCWYLMGAAGAVQFVAAEISPHTSLHAMLSGFSTPLPADARGALWDGVDVGYHSPIRRPECEHATYQCDVLEGGCFYGGSGLAAIELADFWVSRGFDDEVIWEYLAEAYREVFGNRGTDID
jgi:hypothetical protein